MGADKTAAAAEEILGRLQTDYVVRCARWGGTCRGWRAAGSHATPRGGPGGGGGRAAWRARARPTPRSPTPPPIRTLPSPPCPSGPAAAPLAGRLGRPRDVTTQRGAAAGELAGARHIQLAASRTGKGGRGRERARAHAQGHRFLTPARAALRAQSRQALERLQAAGRARAIGISNFEEPHLAQLLAAAGTRPAVNQFEAHPRRPAAALRAACGPAGVAVVAYASLGCGALPMCPPPCRRAALQASGTAPSQTCPDVTSQSRAAP
jgi:hypothetical protein